VVTFSVLAAHQHGSVAPNWPTGIALGAGGLAGGYVGARMHARMPETIIRRLLALVVIAIGIRYLIGASTVTRNAPDNCEPTIPGCTG
jgi:uncharacterized membrane protein YfcA